MLILRKALEKLRLAQFARQEEGISAAEFAIAGPIVIWTIIGILELSMILFVNISVEGGLQQAARYGKLGFNADSASARQAAIYEVLEQKSFGFVDPVQSTITIRNYENLADAAAGTNPIVGPGADRRAAVYIVQYKWHLFTPLFGKIFAEDGSNMDMTARAVVVNEPFQ